MTTQPTRISLANPADISNLTLRVTALTVSLLLFLTSYSVQRVVSLLTPLTPLEQFYGITKEPILDVSDAVVSASLLILVLSSFVFGPTIIRRGRKLQPLSDVDPKAYSTFQECCELCKLNYEPKCYVTEESSDDCFTFGMLPNRASIVVNRSLLQSLDKEQLQALFLHEIGHIVGKDVGVMTWGKAFQRGLRYWIVFALLSVVFSRIFVGWDWAAVLFVVVYLAAPPVLILVVIVPILSLNSFSRNRELMADRFALLSLGNSRSLLSTIRKVAIWNISTITLQAEDPGAIRRFLRLAWLPQTIRKRTIAAHPTIGERVRNIHAISVARITLNNVLPSFRTSFLSGLVAAIAAIGLSVSITDLFPTGPSTSQQTLLFLVTAFVVPASIIAYTNASSLSLRSTLTLGTKPPIRSIPRFLAKLGARNLLSSVAAVSLFAIIATIIWTLISARTKTPIPYADFLTIFSVLLTAYFVLSSLGSLIMFGRFYSRERERFKVRTSSPVTLSYEVPFEKQLRIGKLDSLFLFITVTSGLVFLLVRILTTPIETPLHGFLILVPIILLGWVFPLYYGYVLGSLIRDSAIDRLRGWIFLCLGLLVYGGLLLLRSVSDIANRSDPSALLVIGPLILSIAVAGVVGPRMGKRLERYIFFLLEQEPSDLTTKAIQWTFLAAFVAAVIGDIFGEMDLMPFALFVGMTVLCFYGSGYYASKDWKASKRVVNEGPPPPPD